MDARIPGGGTLAGGSNANCPLSCGAFSTDHPSPDETVLLVGHGGSARILILEALQVPLSTLLHLHLDNASLSRLDFKAAGDSRVLFLNDTSHLESLAPMTQSCAGPGRREERRRGWPCPARTEL